MATLALGSVSVPTFSVAQEYRSYDDYCRHKKKSGQTTGAILGAIGGAVIGSNLAAHSGGRAGGAALGAAAGAAAGSNIGLQAAKCKDGRAYWTEEESYGYRDREHYRRMEGRYPDDWYYEHRCRWARDYDGDWIRVCPDRHGRYYRVD
jgi:hypothetical protein